MKLVALGHEVIGIDSSNGDISDRKLFDQFESAKIEHVFHLAAKSFVPDSWNDPLSFYETNVHGTHNVLEFCRKEGVNVTYVSSYLYGVPERLPISETDKISSNNPYAHSKYLAEQLCEFYSREFNMHITVIRPFNIYGVGQREIFLIPKIIDLVRNESVVKVMDLIPKRDFLFIDDLVDALVLTMNNQNSFSVYNIGSGYSISVKEIIDVIQQQLHSNKPVESEMQTRKNEILDVIADISKAKKELGWIPKTTFEEGIKQMIKLLEEKK